MFSIYLLPLDVPYFLVKLKLSFVTHAFLRLGLASKVFFVNIWKLCALSAARVEASFLYGSVSSASIGAL